MRVSNRTNRIKKMCRYPAGWSGHQDGNTGNTLFLKLLTFELQSLPYV